MTNLVEMSGPRLDSIDILKLNNFDAGLLALKMFSQVYPNATMGDLYNMAKNPKAAIQKLAAQKMAGVKMGKLTWNPLTWIPATIEGTGDMIKSGGSMFGDAWNLLWDSPVGDVVVDGARDKLGLSPIDRSLNSLLETLGNGVKTRVGGLPVWAWVSMAGILGLVLIFAKKKRRVPIAY